MLANVALTDTFDTWRTRTNQLIVQSEENHVLAASAFDTCNNAFNQTATLAAQLLYSNAVVRVALFNYSNTVTAGIASNTANIIFNESNTQNIIGQTANLIAANALSNINVLGVVSANAPATPLLGQFWYDTGSTYTKIFQGSSWVNVMPVGGIFDTVNAAYAYTNTFGGVIANTVARTNTAFYIANLSYDQSNTAYTTAVAGYNLAVAKGVIASAAFDTANAAYGQANLATTYAYATANAAYLGSNGAFTVANAAFGNANSTLVVSSAAFDKANAAYTLASITSGTLTDGATINWNLNQYQVATVTLGGNRTVAAPTNMAVGTFVLRVKQDATGSRTLTWNSVFKFPAGVTPPLSTTGNATDIISFICDGTYMYGSYMLDAK